jgi:hypothetical protein
MEAQLARTRLQSQRIESFVLDENLISLMPIYDLALGGVRLMVRGEDLEKAVKILGQGRRGGFWAPRKLFFYSYFFSPFLVGILIIPLGFIVYGIGVFIFPLKSYVFGSVDKNLLLCIGSISFGVYSFARAEKVSNNNSAWIRKWSRYGIVEPDVRRSVRYLGAFAIVYGTFLALFNEHWFSFPILFWGLLLLVLWKFLFDFISSGKFSNYVKKLAPPKGEK